MSWDIEFFEMVFDAIKIGAVGHKMLCEFTGKPGTIYGGDYFRRFTKLAVFVEWKHGITCVKDIKTAHVYELLDYLREQGFKDSTLRGYICAFRQIYEQYREMFSDDYQKPTYAAYGL